MKRFLHFLIVMHAALPALAYSYGFAEGTNIQTPEGQKKIENLRVGDEIISCTSEGKCAISKITKRNIAKQEAIKITTKYGELIVGREKRIFFSGKWIAAEDIHAGDILQHHSGIKVDILSIEEFESVRLYAIEVDLYHNLYANMILAHNHYFAAPIDGIKVELANTFALRMSAMTESANHYAELCAKGAKDNLASSLLAGAMTAASVTPVAGIMAFGAGLSEGCVTTAGQEYLENNCTVQ